MTVTDRIVCSAVLLAGGLVAAVLAWPFASAVIGVGTGMLLVGLWQIKSLRAYRARRRADEETRMLAVLAYHDGLSGYPLSRLTGFSAGKVYVILARLESQGRVVSRWADEPGPRRRFYWAVGREAS